MSIQNDQAIHKDYNEDEFFIELVNICTKNSEYTLVAGAPSEEYFDLDEGVILPGTATKLSDIISKKINELAAEGNEFDKIGFVEKASGPVGLISMLSSIIGRVNKESIIIRPDKSLLRDTVKGNLKQGDRVLLLNDVATTGKTIFEAAEKIWLRGAKVPYALVIMDRLQGASENLRRKGITLFSIKNTDQMNEYGEKIFKPFHESKPIFKDFGGTSLTFAR